MTGELAASGSGAGIDSGGVLRRDVVGAGVALALTGCAPAGPPLGRDGPAAAVGTSGPAAPPPGGGGTSPAGPAPASSLKAAAAASGRRFGSAVAWSLAGADRGSFANPAYAALLERDCTLLVPENEMKWQSIRPAPERYDFDRFDAIASYARRQGFALRGHTLLWHQPRWFPEWLNNYDFGTRPASEAERILTHHIETVIDRYTGVITSYDVVNEAVDTATGGMIETSLSRALGGADAVVELAFRVAHARAPGVELVYNDYMSWEPGNQTHRAGVLRLLERLRNRNVPVQALGIQSHIEMLSIDPTTGVGPYQEREWRGFCDAVVAMGYRLLITEFDVKDNALPTDIALRDRQVADYTRRYFELMLDYPQLQDVLAWGMTSRFSWLQGFRPRADGAEVRGSPYDSGYRPTAMHQTLLTLFAAARPRG